MSATFDVFLTPSQIALLVKTIDRAGPPPPSEGPARSHSSRSTEALLRARANLIHAYDAISPAAKRGAHCPLGLPLSVPWRVERINGERAVIFEPVDQTVDIPHEGVCT